MDLGAGAHALLAENELLVIVQLHGSMRQAGVVQECPDGLLDRAVLDQDVELMEARSVSDRRLHIEHLFELSL
eukprot:6652681-Pyramimonas_sp.AAC.1